MIPVRFYRTDANAPYPPEHIATEMTSGILLPGQWERVSAVYPIPAADVDMTFQVIVDGDQMAEECNEDNNTSDATSVFCPGVR